MSEQLNELSWKPTPEQEKWLGGANRQDPYILWRMPGKKPPISYFKDPSDQELAKAIGYVEKPAPVDDRSIFQNPNDIDPDAPGEDMNTNPNMDPAVKTQARPDDKNKSEPKELPAEPTKTDIEKDTVAGFDKQADADADLSTTASTNNAARDGDRQADADKGLSDLARTNSTVADFDRQADADAGLSKRSKYDPEIGRFVDYDAQGRPDYDEMYMVGAQDNAAEPEAKAADFEADPEIGDKTGEIAARYNIDPNSQQADQLARQELGMDDEVAKAKQAANPVASADTQKGTDQNAMRDTLNKLLGQVSAQATDNLKPADTVLSPEDEAELAAKYDQDAELQQAMDQDSGLDYDQGIKDIINRKEQPASVKDTLNKALDMNKVMPNTVGDDQDLMKALGGNLDWLDKNIK